MIKSGVGNVLPLELFHRVGFIRSDHAGVVA